MSPALRRARLARRLPTSSAPPHPRGLRPVFTGPSQPGRSLGSVMNGLHGRRSEMRRGTVIGVTLLGIALAALIAVGAYHAGSHHALATTTTTGGQVVHVVGPGYYGHLGWGFFPFFLFFPLLIFGFFFLMRGLFWGR